MLVLAGSAFGHIFAMPGVLVAGDTQAVRLSVHNDLDRPMTGLTVAAPSGLRILGAESEAEWESVVEDNTVTWSGGPLAPNTGNPFALDIAVDEATQAGPVQLEANQLYPGGGAIPWPISVTVVPPEDDDAQLVTWAIVAGIFVLVTAGIISIAVLRRGRPLQEK